MLETDLNPRSQRVQRIDGMYSQNTGNGANILAGCGYLPGGGTTYN
jgi:hypothetical protein